MLGAVLRKMQIGQFINEMVGSWQQATLKMKHQFYRELFTVPSSRFPFLYVCYCGHVENRM
jgi:hypothetical protein